MKPIIWVIAVVVLQAIVAALAKKAQANQEAARAAKSAGSAAGSPAGSTPAPAAPPVARKKSVAKSPPPKRPAAPAAKSAPRVAPPRVAPPRVATPGDSDSDSAMQSRQHLADSVARLQAAEAKIRNAGVTPKKPAAATPAAPKFGSFSLSKALRNPARVREAFIMGEVLGRPKSDRP